MLSSVYIELKIGAGETRAVTVWEYRKINLSELRPRNDDLDLLNEAGASGWELVSIASNNIAYLKRPTEAAPACTKGSTKRTEQVRSAPVK